MGSATHVVHIDGSSLVSKPGEFADGFFGIGNGDFEFFLLPGLLYVPAGWANRVIEMTDGGAVPYFLPEFPVGSEIMVSKKILKAHPKSPIAGVVATVIPDVKETRASLQPYHKDTVAIVYQHRFYLVEPEFAIRVTR